MSAIISWFLEDDDDTNNTKNKQQRLHQQQQHSGQPPSSPGNSERKHVGSVSSSSTTNHHNNNGSSGGGGGGEQQGSGGRGGGGFLTSTQGTTLLAMIIALLMVALVIGPSLSGLRALVVIGPSRMEDDAEAARRGMEDHYYDDTRRGRTRRYREGEGGRGKNDEDDHDDHRQQQRLPQTATPPKRSRLPVQRPTKKSPQSEDDDDERRTKPKTQRKPSSSPSALRPAATSTEAIAPSKREPLSSEEGEGTTGGALRPNPTEADSPKMDMERIRNMDFARFIGSGDEPPEDGEPLCEFYMLGLPGVCKIAQGQETAIECLQRLGASSVARALPTRCLRTRWWKEKGSRIGPAFEEGRSAEVDRDPVYKAQILDGEKDRPRYIPPSQRTHLANDIGSKRCSFGFVHPINFGIAKRSVVSAVTKHKIYDWLPYNMRKFPPWEFRPGPYRMGAQDEFLTHLLHRHSYFAWTHKRGGWDCMRHYEIMAAGTIPYFADLAKCHEYCLTMLPKKLLMEAMSLPGVDHIGHLSGLHSRGKHIHPEFIESRARPPANLNYIRPGKIIKSSFDASRYFSLAERIRDHTEKYLTTASVMSYVLSKIGYEEPKHVLVMVIPNMDYMDLTVESGIADLGLNYTTNHIRPEWHQHYEKGKSPQEIKERRGRGADGEDPPYKWTTAELEDLRNQHHISSTKHGACMLVGMRTPPLVRSTRKERIIQGLERGDYDLVIYTSFHENVQNYELWNHVSRAIPKERRVFIDGGDESPDNNRALAKGAAMGHVFRRELHPGSC